MAATDQLVVMMTTGYDDERSSVAWSVANGGISGGLKLTVFLTSSAVVWGTKGQGYQARPNPLDPPIGEMIQNLIDRGGKVFVCPPCARVRGIEEEDLLDGVVMKGSGAMHERIKEGAATLCF